MTQSLKKHSGASMLGGLSGERLGPQQRESVADRLLGNAKVSLEYAEDIVSCVADMVPCMASGLRLSFVMKLYSFIVACGHFQDRHTFGVFGGPMLESLTDTEKLCVADAFKAGLRADMVLSCEAHAWGLVHVAAFLPRAALNDYLLCLGNANTRSALGSKARDVLLRFIMNLENERRAEAARFVASRIRLEHSHAALSDLVDVLTALTPAVFDEERVFIADAVAPLIFETDVALVRKALTYFTVAIRLLPVPHRLPFALMLTGIAHDIALSDDTAEALKKIEPSLASPEERARIEFALGFAAERDGDAGGLTAFAAPYMSPE